ncbi:MAG: ABC transporter permease [Phycisphaerae bacterium]|jgi:putative ABC transport system permease protein|nr:ABC transporter permease [Phycisphaerae bacterium]
MNAKDIAPWQLASAYLLLILPLTVILWYRIPILGQTALAVLRMTAQLVFVGLYLQVVFELNNLWLNLAWLSVMVIVADVSVARSCGLRLTRIALPLFAALLLGAAAPMLIFTGLILRCESLMDAQYAIPIGGMILGNCLRADIVGIRTFYSSIRTSEKSFHNSLAQGALLHEAVRPFITDACQSALAPAVATMATIGLVSLPGMMTGVILGGASPFTAIKYQIAIMIAIFSGTSVTVTLGIRLTMRSAFNHYGLLKESIFKDGGES